MHSPVVERYPTKTPMFQSESNLASFCRNGHPPEEHPFPELETEHIRFLSLQAFIRSLAIVANRVTVDQKCGKLDQPAQDI